VAPPANTANGTWKLVRFVDSGGTLTGQRTVTGNMLCGPDFGAEVSWANVGINGYTIRGNCFTRAYEEGTGAYPVLTNQVFSGNLFYLRRLASEGTQWSFLGNGGTTIDHNYYFNDQGPVQNNDHDLMAADGTGANGTWLYSYSIDERSGPQTSGFHCTHPGGTGTGEGYTQVMELSHFLVLPEGNGVGSCTVALRGFSTGTTSIHDSTLITASSGGLIAGCCGISGWAGYIATVKNNLFWGKSVGSAGTDGYGAHYISTVADTIASGAVDYNAHYNARTGNLYDQAGANGIASTGYDGFRVTNNSSFNLGAHDINLGTGSNEALQGPLFVDPTRSFASFDSGYLGHTAASADGNAISAWQDAHAYVAGDTVSASTTGWYGGRTINYRCVKAHTSAAADATNGKPGNYTVATSYRTNWEFASAYSIRKAMIAGTTVTDGALGLSGATIIDALREWVRAGWMAKHTALRKAGNDGSDIGCCGVALPRMIPQFAVTIPLIPRLGSMDYDIRLPLAAWRP